MLFLSDIRMDEDIGTYEQVLDNDDRKYSLAEEINMRMFGVQTMLESSYKALYCPKEDKEHKQKLTGIHTYDLLRNQNYIQQFQYFAANTPYRDDMIIDNDDCDANNSAQSDLVRIVLNMAYFRPEELKNLDFSANGLQKLAESAGTMDIA